MSKTVSVDFGDRWFWAYDVSLGLLLLEAIEVGSQNSPQQLAKVVSDLEAPIELGANTIFQLDNDHWDQEQRAYVASLVAEAGQRMRARGVIPAAEANRRYRLGDQPFHLRMADQIDGAVIADLADAIALLIRDELPPEPDADHHWFYGIPDGPRLL